MEITEERLEGTRSSIREHLELLANPNAQRDYERDAPIADVPAELFCGWFDDSYHPEDPAFQAAFNPRELALLADFNDLFAAAEREIPEIHPCHGLQSFRSTPRGVV